MDIIEFFSSRKVMLAKDTETATLDFVGYGTDDDAVARADFALAIPAFFTAFTNPLTLLYFDSYTLGGLFWKATAYYGPDTAPPFPAVGIAGPPTPVAAAPGLNTPLGPDFSFDFNGVIEHITQSKQTVASYKRGAVGGAADTQRAIGVTKDGQILGCDKVSPNFEWSRTVTFGSVTLEYLQTVSGLVGSTNNATFYNFPAKSLIFLGGNAQTKDTMRAVCTFKFLHRPNLTGITICNDLPFAPEVIDKKGSEFLWVSYKNVDNANKITQQPDAVYIERICDEADFADLRIGV